MNRNQKQVYCFIYDDNKHFYSANQFVDGNWVITSNSQMIPLKHNPKNLLDSPIEFATNKQYFSMNRTISYPLEFTFDGAAILNSKYLKGKGFNENLYFAIFEFDAADGIYKLSYNGKFDFQQKKRNEKISTFTISVIDDSAWGVLSQNDQVEYAFNCNASNPKAIKVLFDNFTLQNRYTYQPVASDFYNDTGRWIAFPFVLVNQEGDSAGIIAKSQTSFSFTDTPSILSSNAHFFETFYDINGVNIQGTFDFLFTLQSGNTPAFELYFISSLGTVPTTWIYQNLVTDSTNKLVNGTTYSIPFDFNFNLLAGEKLFLVFRQYNFSTRFTITPIVTNIFVSTSTKAQPQVAFALRPLDLLQEIVNKGTLERYTIDSEFFKTENKAVITCGDALRGIKDAKIYTSFRDFFDTYSALFFMALRVVNGSLFMELADEVYKQGQNIIDLGEIMECETSPAMDYVPNQIDVGSPDQDYRHQNGRLEFNSTNSFALPFMNVKSKVQWITKYRTDGFGMIFLMLDYNSQSTQDNSGDKTNFVVDITDDQESAQQDVETFENINVNNAPLSPIIKFPLTGAIINNDKPVLRGVGIPGSNVNIYIEDVLDGGTTVDANGNWEYQIVSSLPSYNPGVFDGISNINATNTDMLGVLDTIQLIIDTTVATGEVIIYPKPNDGLYNNLPLIEGAAPAGTNVTLNLDGAFLATVVTDNSCRWRYKFTTPISNGTHLLETGTLSVSFEVNAFTSFPLITYIGSELDGFPIVNNLPIIRGVGIPGTQVNLYLNYIPYNKLGSTVVDANGDWSFQVVPQVYIDPITSLPVVLAPIRNGLNIISTSLINNTVKVTVTGYKLNRPAYDSITGVPDNTVFNTRLSPKRMLINHKSMLSAIMDKQRNDYITFQKALKNGELRTVIGTEVVYERDDVQGASLGDPLCRLEYANIKVVAKKNFAQTLYDFNEGGTIIGTFKGTQLYFLPIGSMKLKNIMDDVQSWQLLISPQTSYTDLLNLYKHGLTINLMQNSFFHSDYNSLHFVAYDFQKLDKYNFKELYDDWFTQRSDAWTNTPQYIQKFQRSEPFRDQIITRGLNSLTLRMYRCRDARLIHTYNYDPVNPAPIPGPEIVMETPDIDLSDYPADQYFFVPCVDGVPIAISERIDSRDSWPRTILVESRNSINMPGVFYSTGFTTIIRIEGLVKKFQPTIDSVIATEESGDTRTVWTNVSRRRVIRFGNAQGIPDYMSMKMANAIANDTCRIEGQLYSIEDGEKITPSDDTDGVPTYYYNVNMRLQENNRGVVFAGQPGADTTGVVLVVDASAIGLPPDVLINIDEQ